MFSSRGLIKTAILLAAAGIIWTGCTAQQVSTAATTPAAVPAPAATSPAPYSGDRILTFGGGPEPQHSQASLEQNVLYFRRVLKELGLSAIHNDVYFTDGSSTDRTVVQQVASTPSLEFRQTLAGLYDDDADAVQTQFRAPQISDIAGPSTPDSIANWFSTVGKTMQPKDRLMVYFTGHGEPLPQHGGGGTGGRRNPATAAARPVVRGTILETWNDTSISTKDFITNLDKLDPDVAVTLVMVQCFSGGFANVIYKDGDPAKGFSKAHRCGFFATISTRPAAGCTADINGDDYEEFSTSFFAALSGKTRAGKLVERPDYNHAGVTTFTDAFTYVLLTSNTIDIPMTTSDQLLRDRSRLGKGDAADAKLLNAETPYPAMLAAATPSQKAALDGLSAILNLTGDNRTAAARTMAEDIDRQRLALQKTAHDSDTELSRLSAQIRSSLENRWPELGVRWHPDTEATLAKDAAQIQAAIEAHPSYKAWQNARDRMNAASDKDSDLERKWVKIQRFLARADTVMLAANLDKVAQPDVIQFYNDLIAQENQTLTAWKAQKN